MQAPRNGCSPQRWCILVCGALPAALHDFNPFQAPDSAVGNPAAPATSAASPGKLLSQTDVSRAQAGAEMAPAEPAAARLAAAPLGEARGSRGARAGGRPGERSQAGSEPWHWVTCAESLWGAAA